MMVHPGIILFNVFGWMFRKTRKANLILLIITAFSWVVLGLWKGIGYCPFTDWHFEILRKLGETDLPDSYITYLISRITGWHPADSLVYTLTWIVFLLAFLISAAVNFIDWKRKKT